MRFLFVHQNFPGQYLHIVRHLLRDPDNEVVFIAEPNANAMPGVRRVSYQLVRPQHDDVHANVRDLDLAARRAEAVANAARTIRGLGFTPDIVIGHHGWGELLDLVDVWPGVPILGYFEFYYRAHGQDVGYDPEFPHDPARDSRVRSMNAINHLALALEQHGQTPTMWQRERYPAWAQARIGILPEGARIDTCRPDPLARETPLDIAGLRIAPGDRLVTYVVRNLEPYRGFHTMMRALPDLLERRDVKVVLVGGDDVSYGARLANSTWREHFQRELAGRYDAARVAFPGQVPYDLYLRLLQRSNVHVYLTYPFVASWSLREALACGCTLVAADVAPVREFVADGRTGVLVPGLDPRAVAAQVLALLDAPDRAGRLGTAARRFAERHLDMAIHLGAYEARIAELTGRRIDLVARAAAN